eukprot:Sdes_comp10426_c0_seq1m2101
MQTCFSSLLRKKAGLFLISKPQICGGLHKFKSFSVSTQLFQQEISPPQMEKLKAALAKLTPLQRSKIHSMIRVDHAGEFGADRIYAGQFSVLQTTPVGPVIHKMWLQEKRHLKIFNQLLVGCKVRPTLMHPVWSIAGWALGAGSALLGKEAAMACTVAVETVIGEHYDSQLRQILEMDPNQESQKLMDIIKEFRDEELEHLETGLHHDGEKAPFYEAFTFAIKTGCQAAIWISKRI